MRHWIHYLLATAWGLATPVLMGWGSQEIIEFFKTGKAPVSPEETLEIMAFMEAAEMSAKRGGAPVTLEEAKAACGQ